MTISCLSTNILCVHETMERRKSKTDLFLQLAQPDENGVSRWVMTTEFTGEYERLQIRNGGHCCRKGSLLAKRYNIEVDKSQTKGNKIDAIKLNGYRKNYIEENIEPTDDNAYNCLLLNRIDYNPWGETVNTRSSTICKKCRQIYKKNVLRDSYSRRQNLCLCKFMDEITKQVMVRIYGERILHDFDIESKLRNYLAEREPTY